MISDHLKDQFEIIAEKAAQNNYDKNLERITKLKFRLALF